MIRIHGHIPSLNPNMAQRNTRGSVDAVENYMICPASVLHLNGPRVSVFFLEAHFCDLIQLVFFVFIINYYYY